MADGYANFAVALPQNPVVADQAIPHGDDNRPSFAVARRKKEGR